MKIVKKLIDKKILPAGISLFLFVMALPVCVYSFFLECGSAEKQYWTTAHQVLQLMAFVGLFIQTNLNVKRITDEINS